MAREMTDRLDKKMLLLADRGFIGHDIWATFSQSGAQLLWRVGSNIKLEPIKTLKDGSTLALLNASKESARTGAQAITVRVIEYELDGVAKPDTEGARYRLITTLLDPREAPALELARLYQERWEIEILLDELKTHLRGRSALLRSKTPDLVKQEAYGLLLVHHAVRRIMLDAAQSIGDDPDRISFTATVRIIRRKLLQGSFSPLDEQGSVEE
ncbi:MAG: IS4 family transposase [Fibrobacteres bacterium]|nr:IS4 family transposase [Fibrobacterota bacterium]